MKQKYYITLIFLLFLTTNAGGRDSRENIRGLFISQHTVHNKTKFNNLITAAELAGLNTLITDLHVVNRPYKRHIKALADHNRLRYVARIIVFPKGGSVAEVTSRAYVDKRIKLALQAVELGADEILLDYIRYSIKQPSSKKNSGDILRVIQRFRRALAPSGVKLTIATFGDACFKPSESIGQDIPLFANSIDAVYPMLYPSHYEPFRKHAQDPHYTLLSSLQSLAKQMIDRKALATIPFIELWNYRYSMNEEQRIKYVREQIRGVREGGAQGWIAWSAGNHYETLFKALGVKYTSPPVKGLGDSK